MEDGYIKLWEDTRSFIEGADLADAFRDHGWTIVPLRRRTELNPTVTALGGYWTLPEFYRILAPPEESALMTNLWEACALLFYCVCQILNVSDLWTADESLSDAVHEVLRAQNRPRSTDDAPTQTIYGEVVVLDALRRWYATMTAARDGRDWFRVLGLSGRPAPAEGCPVIAEDNPAGSRYKRCGKTAAVDVIVCERHRQRLFDLTMGAGATPDNVFRYALTGVPGPMRRDRRAALKSYARPSWS